MMFIMFVLLFCKNTINNLGSKSLFRKFIHCSLLILFSKSFFGFAFPFFPDTIPVKPDSLNINKKSKSALESKVEYQASDSMVFDVDSQKMFLFGKGEVKYEGTSLKANYIELGMKDNILFAKGTDSAGKKTGQPFFDDSGQNFTAQEIKYNFKTKKGKIFMAITQQGDGFIHGETIKKGEEDILYIKNGKYTTCSNEEPHFHIEANKLKVIKDDKIVTGPAYLVIENAPTPLAVPFGMFPNKKERSSGIVIPAYGQSPTLGFFLTDGGVYLGLNEYFDAKILLDAYTRGSWAGQVASTYRKRYKFNGMVNAKYSVFLVGDKELPNFQADTNFFIKWQHKQDPKSNPTGNFSADVNFGTSNSFKKDLNSNSIDFLTNTFKSSVTYQKTFSIFNVPANFNLNGSHDQNTRDSLINVTLPQMTFNINRFSPFKRKVRIGEVKWYESIGLSYQSLFTNTLTFKEGIFKDHPTVYTDKTGHKRDTFLLAAPQDTLFSMMKNGISHNIPISTSIKILKYFNLSPQLNYSEKWYFETRKFKWNEDSLKDGVKNKYVADTIKLHKFDRFNEYGAGASISTTVYGMYSIRSGWLQGIRHMMVPSAAINYRPDFSLAKFGYFDSLVRPRISDPTQDSTVLKYSRFQNGIMGGPSSGKSAILNFSLTNSLEMKVGSKKDTVTGNKKIKIFENLNFSSNYNLLADSMNLSPIQIAARTNLFQALNLNFSGVLNPYKIYRFGKNGNGEFRSQRVDTLVWTIPNWWTGGRPLGTFTDAQLSLSLNLNGGNNNKPKTSNVGTEAELAQINSCPDCYVDFNVPWTLNLNYNFIYQKPLFIYSVTNSFTFSGDIRLTEKWKIGFNSGYDFKEKDLTYTSLDIYRDLHCWEMRLNLIPFGPRQSYVFNINVKSAVLQDLKLTRRKQWFDN